MSCRDEKLQVRTHLSKLLINDSKLEVVADNMLIKRDNEPGCLSGGEECTFSGLADIHRFETGGGGGLTFG